MATSSALNLIIDITNPGKAGIIQSFQNRLPQTVPIFIRNDVETVSLRFVQPSAGTSRPWDDVDYTTAETIMGLGEFDVVPTSGTNTFQFGPQTTGTYSSASTAVTVASATGIVNGMLVAGPGIVTGTTCTISGTSVTLSQNTTEAGSGAPLYFYNETASVATGASAAVVSTAVNALASVIAAGNVTVSSPEAGVYLFVLPSGVTAGHFSGNPSGLNPASSIVVSEVVVGASGVASEQLMEIFVNPYALNLTWTDFAAASATVVSLSSGASHTYTGNNTTGANTITSLSGTTGLVVGMAVSGTGVPANTVVLAIVSSTATISNPTTSGSSGGSYTFTTPSVQQITLTPGAYDGSISIATPLITTQAIACTLTGTTATAIQTALNALGANYTVTGNAGGPYTVSDSTGSNTTITVNVTGMIVPIGLLGSLSLSTYAMLQKFIAAGTPEVTLELEVQVTPSGGGQSTPLQISVGVSKNVINLTSIAPSPQIIYLTQSLADTRYTRQSNDGSDFTSLSQTLKNLWVSIGTTIGDLIYSAASGVATRLAGNTTSTKKFLTQTGTGSASAAPAWGSIVTADLPIVRATGTLIAGTVTITNGTITTSSLIVPVHNCTVATNNGALYASALSTGSVTITSTNAGDIDGITVMIQ